MSAYPTRITCGTSTHKIAISFPLISEVERFDFKRLYDNEACAWRIGHCFLVSTALSIVTSSFLPQNLYKHHRRLLVKHMGIGK